MFLCYNYSMGGMDDIRPPKGDDDINGAQRVFEDFLVLYQPTMSRVEEYLEKIVEETRPAYAEAYRPWLKALQDMMQGIYLVAKKIPLPDSESFMESLRMFSFESAIDFLRDICVCCRHILPRDWTDRFREHINMLLFSLSILNRQEQSLGR